MRPIPPHGTQRASHPGVHTLGWSSPTLTQRCPVWPITSGGSDGRSLPRLGCRKLWAWSGALFPLSHSCWWEPVATLWAALGRLTQWSARSFLQQHRSEPGNGFSSPAEPFNDCSPSLIAATWETLNQMPTLLPSPAKPFADSDSQKLCETINIHYFKLLHVGVICYPVIDK